MTRRTLNADGTITLKSSSYWGEDRNATETLQQELAELEEFNRKARADWDSLTPEERERSTSEFETQRKAWNAARPSDLEIPYQSQIKMNGQDSSDPPAFI